MPDHTPAARPTWSTIVLLVIPPMLWAGNAVVGRMMQQTLPPFTFNFLRWVLAGLLLLPLAGWVLRTGSGLGRAIQGDTLAPQPASSSSPMQ